MTREGNEDGCCGWSCEDVGRREKIGRREGERSLNKPKK
jgi:hypothetical protein